MSDQTKQEPDQLLTIDERAEGLAYTVIGGKGLVTSDGKQDYAAITDLIYPDVLQALVETPGQRSQNALPIAKLMEKHFSELPGPTEWADIEDEDERATVAKAYAKVKGWVTRTLNVMPQGHIQSRLASDSGLTLCRRDGDVYVTRNHKCMDEDNNAPILAKAQRLLAQAGALTAMSIDRVPEKAKWFQRQYEDGAKLGLSSGQNIVRAALNSNTSAAGDDSTSVSE